MVGVDKGPHTVRGNQIRREFRGNTTPPVRDESIMLAILVIQFNDGSR